MDLIKKYLTESDKNKLKSIRREFVKFDGTWTDKFEDAVKGTPVGDNLAKQVDDHMEKITKILNTVIK